MVDAAVLERLNRRIKRLPPDKARGVAQRAREMVRSGNQVALLELLKRLEAMDQARPAAAASDPPAAKPATEPAKDPAKDRAKDRAKGSDATPEPATARADAGPAEAGPPAPTETASATAKVPPPPAFSEALFADILDFITVEDWSSWTTLRVSRNTADRLFNWASEGPPRPVLDDSRLRYEQAWAAGNYAAARQSVVAARTAAGQAITRALPAWRQNGRKAGMPFVAFDEAKLAEAGQFAALLEHLPVLHQAVRAVTTPLRHAAQDRDQHREFKRALAQHRLELHRAARPWFFALLCSEVPEPWQVADALDFVDPEFVVAVATAFVEAGSELSRSLAEAGEEPSAPPPGMVSTVRRAHALLYTLLTRVSFDYKGKLGEQVSQARAEAAESLGALLPPLTAPVLELIPIVAGSGPQGFSRPDLTRLPSREALKEAQRATELLSRIPFLARETSSEFQVSDSVKTVRKTLLDRAVQALNAASETSDLGSRQIARKQASTAILVFDKLGYGDEADSLRRELAQLDRSTRHIQAAQAGRPG